MMHLSVTTHSPTEWDRFVTEMEGNLFHSRQWAEMGVSPFSRPLYFLWSSASGRQEAVAVGIERWSRLPVIGRRLKRLELETYPAVSDGAGSSLEDALQHMVAFARSSGFMEIEIRSYMAPRSVAELADMGLSTKKRTEFVVDLTLPEEKLLKHFSSHHRRKLKKARKHGLELIEATTLEAMREFRRLQVLSRDRRLERGEDIGVLDDAYYEDLGEQYFQNNLGRVFLAVHNGQPVSAAFVTLYAGQALYAYGGSSDEGFRLDAPAYLFWRIFARCRDLGCTRFNLGGVPAEAADPQHPSHGLFRFKAGFGGTQVPCLSATGSDLQPVLGRIRRALDVIRRYQGAS